MTENKKDEKKEKLNEILDENNKKQDESKENKKNNMKNTEEVLKNKDKDAKINEIEIKTGKELEKIKNENDQGIDKAGKIKTSDAEKKEISNENNKIPVNNDKLKEKTNENIQEKKDLPKEILNEKKPNEEKEKDIKIEKNNMINEKEKANDDKKNEKNNNLKINEKAKAKDDKKNENVKKDDKIEILNSQNLNKPKEIMEQNIKGTSRAEKLPTNDSIKNDIVKEKPAISEKSNEKPGKSVNIKEEKIEISEKNKDKKHLKKPSEYNSPDVTLDLDLSKNIDNSEFERNLIKLNESKIDNSMMDSECKIKKLIPSWPIHKKTSKFKVILT